MGSTRLNVDNWESARHLFGECGLSVVLPCYNLAPVILNNLARLEALLVDRGFAYELIPVDDGSTDTTADCLREAASASAVVHPIYLNTNRGKGIALRAGANAAQYPWVLLLDGDLDIDPCTLPIFAEMALQTPAEVVVGSKRHPDAHVNYPLRRRIVSALYHTFTRCFLKLPVSDTQSGMKLLQRTALLDILERMLIKHFAFDLELLTIAQSCGYKLAEAPICIPDFGRRWGCLSFTTLWRTAIDTLAIIYRTRILHYYAHLTPLPPIPSAETGPRFSIIVACPGDSVVLRRLINALMAQSYRNFEVIFLPDRLLVRPEVNFRFRILATGSVRPAKKRNMGAVAASGDILAFIDDDAYPKSNWLANAAARFADTKQTIDALGGPGLTPPDDPPKAQLSGAIFASPLVSGNFRYRYFIQGALRRVEDFPSCNLFIRKAIFDEIRGFREDFWPGEDTLLCADLQRQGYTLWYDPRVVVYHHRRPVFLPHLRQIGRYALHRGYFARRIGLNSRRLSYHLPSLFVLGLLGGMPFAFTAFWWALLYIGGVTFYLLITLIDAIIEAPLKRTIIPMWWGILLSHLWYGIRFLQGLCSRQMPCGVRPFDHR